MDDVKQIVFVEIEEYQAIYSNGKLSTQGRDIDLVSFLDGQTVSFSSRSYIASDEEVVAEFNGFPEKLTELLKGIS